MRATLLAFLLWLVAGALQAQPVGWAVYGGAPITVSPSPSTAAVAPTSYGVWTTNSITASAAGGAGGFRYAWSYVSGNTQPAATNPSGASTAWSATASGSVVWSSVWKITATDSIGNTGSNTVSVLFDGTGGGGGGSPLQANVNTSTATVSYSSAGSYTTNSITVTPSYGTPPYSVGWSYSSGSTAPAATAPSSLTTAWSATAPYGNTSYSSGWTVTVLDSATPTQGSVTIPVAITFTGTGPGPLTLAIAPTTASVSYSTGGAKGTNSVTGTASGGTSPYTYAWTRVSGNTQPTPTNASGASTAWTGTPGGSTSWSAVWQLTVTDHLGATASGTVDVEFSSTS